jgi:AraC-like DNA-binding protein
LLNLQPQPCAMSLSAFFHTIILLGALQGFIIGSILFFSKSHRRSNRLLAVLIWVIALASLNLCLNYTNWYYSNTVIAIMHALVPIEYVMPVGPLVYFYICSLSDPDFRITKRQKLQFLPVLFDLVPSFVAIIFIVGVLLKWFVADAKPWGVFIDDYYVYVDIPRWISLSYYIWLSAKYLRSIPITQNSHASSQQVIKLKWLKEFIRIFSIFQLIWLVYLVPYIIPSSRNWVLDTFNWYPIYIPLAFLIYWLGIKGYMVSQSLTAVEKKPGQALPAETIDQVVIRLRMIMEENKLYLEPLLNLSMVSQQTGIPSKTISAVLNQHLHKSFNDYVNEYRIKEFKKKIVEPAFSHLTITGVALECGFNSQATFQRKFKEVTGMSPSEFRKTADELN